MLGCERFTRTWLALTDRRRLACRCASGDPRIGHRPAIALPITAMTSRIATSDTITRQQQAGSIGSLRIDPRALPAVNGWFGAPLISQKIKPFLQSEVELQDTRVPEEQGAVECLARLVTVRLVRR